MLLNVLLLHRELRRRLDVVDSTLGKTPQPSASAS
jgi:hypothetical protein